MTLPLRTLPTGCKGCGLSVIYCHCVHYIDERPCCQSCSHEE